MYKRLDTFLDNKNIIYDLQYGFRQQNSTSHAFINITENIRKALAGGNIGVFVDLQKNYRYCRPPDTVSKTESLWDSWSFKSLI